MNKYSLKRNFATYTMILANVIVFILLAVKSGLKFDTGTMLAFGAEYWPYVIEKGEWWRLFTACFLHFGLTHLLSNMLWLFFFGGICERCVGHVKMPLLYILSGIGGGLVSLLYHYLTHENAVSAGASGACFGLAGIMLYLAICEKGRLRAAGINPARVPIAILLNLASTFASEGVDNFAHVGGLVFGFILALPICAIGSKDE